MDRGNAVETSNYGETVALARRMDPETSGPRREALPSVAAALAGREVGPGTGEVVRGAGSPLPPPITSGLAGSSKFATPYGYVSNGSECTAEEPKQLLKRRAPSA